ncbi:MAG: hypothetical protein JNK64_37555 [Myxococcales bacterium]|nr:hypothetical protein [Myxococcales bacterium]
MPSFLRLCLAASLLLAACADDSADAVCHFASGRPCAPGELCFGPPGDECNYYTCTDGALVGTAVACSAAVVIPVPDGPFVCDPAAVRLRDATITPPLEPCPLGGLYALQVSDAFVGGAQFQACVPTDTCAPIACDPAYGGDGCPTGYGCDAARRRCVIAP